MTFMVGIWIALTAAIAALMFTKQTRYYELLLIGGWGVATGALLAGKASLDGLSVTALWNTVF